MMVTHCPSCGAPYRSSAPKEEPTYVMTPTGAIPVEDLKLWVGHGIVTINEARVLLGFS